MYYFGYGKWKRASFLKKKNDKRKKRKKKKKKKKTKKKAIHLLNSNNPQLGQHETLAKSGSKARNFYHRFRSTVDQTRLFMS
jgi:transposase-like protein